MGRKSRRKYTSTVSSENFKYRLTVLAEVAGSGVGGEERGSIEDGGSNRMREIPSRDGFLKVRPAPSFSHWSIEKEEKQ